MRDFSDAIKYAVVRENLEKNNGRICCETCGKELKSINEGHFDHIKPFAKGGKSTKQNCQILCSNCNLKKNDKELNDFLLDEKARKFLEGLNIEENTIENNSINNDAEIQITNIHDMSKEKFDIIIGNFIERNGNISKVDFKREYNNLPSINYINKYYGDFPSLKKAFNLPEQTNWNRVTIKKALSEYINNHGDIFEKDLKAKNGLPSYPCIIKYYPEYKGLNDLKTNMFNLKVRNSWTSEKAIEAGKEFVKKHGNITLKDLVTENGLPVANVIYRHFGSMEEYQKLVGSKISKKNELITIEEIDKTINTVFESRDRKFETRKEFFNIFPISQSVVYRIFGSFDAFCIKYNIEIKKKKKAKFTKQEIDEIILNYIKAGNSIPTAAKSLVKLGLPSRDAIMNFYRDWHEPFVLYSKLYEKIN